MVPFDVNNDSNLDTLLTEISSHLKLKQRNKMCIGLTHGGKEA